jgi:hypothetical protein
MEDGVRPDGGKADRTAAFAAALRELRDSAGTPSFRRMAQLSGCVSHTTLHEAATGSRFPSWETTREFVLACGADPESWRDRWTRAGTAPNQAATPTEPEPPAVDKSATAESATDEAATDESTRADVESTRAGVESTRADVESTRAGVESTRAGVELTRADVELTRADVELTRAGVELTRAGVELTPAGVDSTPAGVDSTPAVEPAVAVEPVVVRPRPWRRGWVLAAAVALVVVLTAVGLAIGLHRSSSAQPASLARTHPTTAPSDAGDSSKFVADVTFPDGTVVGEGQPFQKVWELQNTGSVIWHDRYLQRMDEPAAPGSCRTPARVPIGDTLPGQNVWISVNVVARDTPGTCWVGWKMADESGRLFLPGYRPVYFLVTVRAQHVSQH